MLTKNKMLLFKSGLGDSPLDQYADDIIGCWSYYKTLSDYSGSCMRVRRSSDNAEQDFGFKKLERVNLCRLKNVVLTGSVAITNPENMHDGENNLANFAANGSNSQWVKFDFGQEYDIYQVRLWHYISLTRTYHDVIVQYSTDDTNWTNIFNNDADNSSGQGVGTDSEYSETYEGKTINSEFTARYIRLWTNGNTDHAYNAYTEVQAFTYNIDKYYVDYESILNFCGTASDSYGYVTKFYNQNSNGNDAYQAITAYQPMIVYRGLFYNEGIKFKIASSNSLRILTYDAFNIIDNPLSIYNNYTSTDSSITGYVFYKGENSSNTTQFGVLRTSTPNNGLVIGTGVAFTAYAQTTALINTPNKLLYNWTGKGTNELVAESNNGNNTGTVSTQLLDKNNIFIGARSNASDGSTVAALLEGEVKTIVVSKNLMSYNVVSQI